MKRRPLVIAHRGASANAVDNSLEAFRKAIQIGADLIEFDARCTRDAQLVAYHDAGVSGVPLDQLTRAEIAERTGHKPPLLEEVLTLAKGRVGVDIELKEPGYTERVLAAALDHFKAEEVLVTSFHDAVVREAKRFCRSIRTGLLIGLDRPQHLLRTRLSEVFPVRRARACGADYLVMHYRLAQLGALRRAHRAGFPALIWTINDADRLTRYLSDRRVCAVITDEPARAIALRGTL